MMRIGTFSKLSRISIRMLRHYDELGLLAPKTIDPFTGYRYYAEDQLQEIARITALRDMGFGLSAVAEILKCYANPQALAEFLAIRQAEVQSEVKEAEQRLLLLETAIKRLRKDETAMHYNVILKTIPERYVASVRKVIPAYDQEGMLWEILAREMVAQNIQYTQDCNSLAVFHDEGYKESDVDVEIQMSVKGQYRDTADVVFKTVPAVEVASATYKGSYAQLTDVNHAVASWMKDNGYDFGNMMFCIYHVSPGQTDCPEEYVTEVCYAIKKK